MTTTAEDTAKALAWLKGLTNCEWMADENGYHCEHDVRWKNDFVRALMTRIVTPTPTATVAQERKEREG
jgi:hypothetical protein